MAAASFGASPFGGPFAAAAGEPHFVGFDGLSFDYHGMPRAWYRLWYTPNLQLDAYFDLELAAEKYETFVHTTFMTKIRLRHERTETIYQITDNWRPLEEHLDPTLAVAWARGIAPELQHVEGDVVGAQLIRVPDLDILLTCFSFKAEFNFLNVSLAVTAAVAPTAAGILGQTLAPPSQRRPNSKFLVSVDV
jgi:hypothetical protein